MKNLLLVTLALVGIVGWASSPIAADLGQARAYMQNLGDQAVGVMTASDIDEQERLQRFTTLFRDNVEVPTIGRFVLGTHWRGATEAQQQRFLQLFEAALLRNFSTQFNEFSGISFEIGDVRAEGENDAFVAMRIERDRGPPLNTTWRVRDRGGSSFKVLDVYVEGVSMAISQRDEYSAFINSHGGSLDALLDELAS